MATTQQHVVKATLIVVRVDKTERYLEKGATLPEGVSADDRKRLAAAGLIEKAPATKQTASSTNATGSGTNPAPSGEQASAATGSGTTPGGDK